MTYNPSPWVADEQLLDRALSEIDARFPSYFQISRCNDHWVVFLFLVDRFLARSIGYTRANLSIDYDWEQDYTSGLSPEDSCNSFLSRQLEEFIDVHV